MHASRTTRCLLVSVAMLAMAGPGVANANMHDLMSSVCYSTPTAVTAAVPVGVGVTTHASASSSAGCTPTVQGGVRGFLMTVTWTGTVSGNNSLFLYSSNCGTGWPKPGPATGNCGGTSTWFCAAPGTQKCSATAPAFSVSIVNNTLGLDNATATSTTYSLTCQYLA